jgi:hypothetical protein
MKKLILVFTLPLMLFLFSLTPTAKACTACTGISCPFICGVPEGALRAYHCELDCPSCPEGDPQCKACDRLEIAFPSIECWGTFIDCEQPPQCLPGVL